MHVLVNGPIPTHTWAELIRTGEFFKIINRLINQ